MTVEDFLWFCGAATSLRGNMAGLCSATCDDKTKDGDYGYIVTVSALNNRDWSDDVIAKSPLPIALSGLAFDEDHWRKRPKTSD